VTIPGGSSILLNLNICTPDMDRNMLYLNLWHICKYKPTCIYTYIHTDIHAQESPGHVENTVRLFVAPLCLRPGASVTPGPLVIAKPQVKDAASQVTRGVCGGGRRVVKVYIKG